MAKEVASEEAKGEAEGGTFEESEEKHEMRKK